MLSNIGDMDLVHLVVLPPSIIDTVARFDTGLGNQQVAYWIHR